MVPGELDERAENDWENYLQTLHQAHNRCELSEGLAYKQLGKLSLKTKCKNCLPLNQAHRQRVDSRFWQHRQLLLPFQELIIH